MSFTAFLNDIDFDAGVQLVVITEVYSYVGPVGFPIDYIRRLHSCSVGFGAFFNICYL